jgi:hypothetical protein
MSRIADEPVVIQAGRRPRWTDGILVGLLAATVSTLALLLAGAVTGRELSILADAGMTGLPSTIRAVTGISEALSYLLSHTLIYLLAGVVALLLAGVGRPDSSPGSRTSPAHHHHRVRLSGVHH